MIKATTEQVLPFGSLLRRPIGRKQDPAPAASASPHDPYGSMSESDRTALKSISLSDQQIEALAKDTRLPGEIGCTYGVSAALVIRLQERARRTILKRDKMAAAGKRPAKFELKAKSE